jgi:hypothetical protein
VASGMYNRFRYNLMAKQVDLTSATLKVALMAVGHSFSATDNTWSQVSANEITNTSGSSYVAGGQLLTTPTVTQAAATKFDADDSIWTQASFSAYFAVIYDTYNNNLIACIDFGGVKTVTGGTFTISYNASGIITVT